jgi:8-oxo-dGTP pyrophosphatase MutT (NUDIX family)
VFVVRDGEHLVLRRVDRGIWHVVSGVVEEGETFEEAALRELREESGLALSALRYDLGTQTHGIGEEWRHEFPEGLTEVTISSYGVDAPAGWEPVLNEEHDAHRWCPAEEACEALFWREAQDMVRKLDQLIATPDHPGGP